MNSKLHHWPLLVLVTVVVGLAVAGCNTSKGFGKDVEKLGDKIQDKASK
jgi:entericidin A